MSATLPSNERERLEALHYYSTLDKLALEGLDRITKVASKLFGVSASLITFVGEDRQVIKSQYGLELPDLARQHAICSRTILSPDPLIVCDLTRDLRFANNPLVTDAPGLRFYAGTPLRTVEGLNLGALCVIDFVPRSEPDPDQLSMLSELAKEAVKQLESCCARRDLAAMTKALEGSTQDLAASRLLYRKLDQRAELALQSGRMGIWEWDAASNVISFSPLLHNLLELGDDYQGTFTGWLDHIHPEDREMVVIEVSKARESEEISSFKYRVNMADGSERWITTTGRHQFDDNGVFQGAQGVSWDSTAAELTERQLRMSEERFRGVLAASPVGVYLADLTAGVTYVNARSRETYEMSEEAMRGHGWLERVFPDDREPLVSNWLAANRQGQPYRHEFRLLLPDGRIRWIDGRSVVLRDPEGKAVGTVGTIDDVTDRRNFLDQLYSAKETAEIASRAKDLFLANMSHELRTPLNGVLGMADLLLETPLTPEQLEMVEVIRFSGQSLLSVVNDLLDLSRIEAGQLTVECSPFRIDDAIREAMSLMQPEARKKHLKLRELQPPERPPVVLGDAQRIKQVLINYLSNAIKFTDRGTIMVEAVSNCGPRECDLMLSVRDRGIGISPEAQRKLFQPFTQVDPTSTRQHGGAGLGLAICRRLADLMGGAVGVTSVPLQGSTFWLRLKLPLDEPDNGELCRHAVAREHSHSS